MARSIVVSSRYLAMARLLTVVSASNGTFGKSILAQKVSSGDYFILSQDTRDLLQVPSELTEYAPAYITEDCL